MGMKIAFAHYHLKTGGVTTVIKQQLASLPDHWQSLVVTGSLPQTRFPARLAHVPQIGYSDPLGGRYDPDAVAESILKAIHSRFSGSCDVLHVHNPTLAKNHQFLDLLNALQQKGANLLLQIHDFAEDGRPRSYYAAQYPADCHYSVINGRDYDVLLNCGLVANGLHLLANTVDCPQLPTRPSESQKAFILYPVRAIRRKNIGEAILLSLFIKNGAALSITLPPNSPADISSYNGWKSFVKTQGLNVVFERGLARDFETNVMSADSLVTTSITEGFGFSFLEPWLYGKLLWGRKLPEITRDFEQNGIRLHHLYNRLLVPLDWIGLDQFRSNWTHWVRQACRLLNHEVADSHIRQAFDACTRDGNIDFGLLDEGSQKKIIAALVTSRKTVDMLMRLNPFLAHPGDVSDPDSLIRNNRTAIERGYNRRQYRQKLLDVYERVANTTIRQRIDKKVLAAAFLDLERFSLLKWSDYAE